MRWAGMISGLMLSAVAPAAMQAQEPLHVTLGTGAGMSIPIGDFGDRADLGWTAQANLGLNKATWPVGLRFDVAYQSLGHTDVDIADSQSISIVSGRANFEVGVLESASGGGLMLTAGGGVYRLDFGEGPVGEQNSTDFGIFGGLAYKLRMTNLIVSIEGKFENVFTERNSVQLIPAAVVVEIPISGG